MDDEGGFPFELETDSLADSLGRLLPKRSLYIVTGEVGAGKSLIAQRLAYGLISHGTRLTVVSTELTTRGWLEQVDSLGYSMTEATESGSLTLLSRFGVVSDEVEGVVQIADVLDSKPVQDAEIAIIDRAFKYTPTLLWDSGRIAKLSAKIFLCRTFFDVDYRP